MAWNSELVELQRTMARLYTDVAFRENLSAASVRSPKQTPEGRILQAFSNDRRQGLELTAKLISTKRQRRLQREIPLFSGCVTLDIWRAVWTAFERRNPPMPDRTARDDAEELLIEYLRDTAFSPRSPLLEDVAALELARVRIRDESLTAGAEQPPGSFQLTPGASICTITHRLDDIRAFAIGEREASPEQLPGGIHIAVFRAPSPVGSEVRVAAISARVMAAIENATRDAAIAFRDQTEEADICKKLCAAGLLRRLIR